MQGGGTSQGRNAVVIGGLNAKVGSDNRNGNVERFAVFPSFHRLVIGGTLFKFRVLNKVN